VRIIIGFGFFLMFLMMSGGSFAGDRTYQGRVIDADTKEPIEGAVVVAVWDEIRSVLPSTESRHKDVKETLTDKEGRWSIVGPEGEYNQMSGGLRSVTGIFVVEDPTFIVFKPGYCSWPKGFSVGACKGRVRPSGNHKIINGETIELPKLENREDRLRALIGPVTTTDEKRHKEFLKKQIRFLHLYNEERKNLGLSENKQYKELVNEN
jgi:hypothetical protein